MIILADGFEDIEAFTVIDILRRAKVDVTTVGLISNVVESAHKIRIFTDMKLSDVKPDAYGALILPGGPGYKNLMNSSAIMQLVKDFDAKEKYIAAICAAPLVLAKAGILEKRIAAVYPGYEKQIPRPRDEAVVVDGNIITSRSPGTAMEFAIKLAEILTGKKLEAKLKEALAV